MLSTDHSAYSMLCIFWKFHITKSQFFTCVCVCQIPYFVFPHLYKTLWKEMGDQDQRNRSWMSHFNYPKMPQRNKAFSWRLEFNSLHADLHQNRMLILTVSTKHNLRKTQVLRQKRLSVRHSGTPTKLQIQGKQQIKMSTFHASVGYCNFKRRNSTQNPFRPISSTRNNDMAKVPKIIPIVTHESLKML